MAELSELIVPETVEDVEETMLALLEASDIPVTAWQEDATARVIVGVVAEIAADCMFASAQMANGYVLGISGDAWLMRLAESQFDEEKLPPVLTVGTVTVTDAGGGPHTITAGQLTFSTATGVLFTNTSGGTLTLNGTLDLTVAAVATGGAGNVPVDSITVMVTSLATVTVNNPAIGLTATWITTYGSDPESDTVLTRRLQAKWGTLSTGSPESAYLYWAYSTSGVSRAKVDALNPDGPGTVRVYVDNAGSVSALQTTIDGKMPAGSGVAAVAATAQSVSIAGAVTVRAAQRASAEVAVAAALVALQNEIDIGGIVRQSEVIERVMSPAGVVDFALGSSWTGSPNIQLGSDKIPSFTVSLSWVEV